MNIIFPNLIVWGIKSQKILIMIGLLWELFESKRYRPECVGLQVDEIFNILFYLHILLLFLRFVVIIRFANNKLKRIVNDDRMMIREMGKLRASLLRRRLTQIEDAITLEDLRYLSGNYHELKHNRKGQWCCDLDQPYRLIFAPIEQPIPINTDGQYLWFLIYGVEIIEIINYHKEK